MSGLKQKTTPCKTASVSEGLSCPITRVFNSYGHCKTSYLLFELKWKGKVPQATMPRVQLQGSFKR